MRRSDARATDLRLAPVLELPRSRQEPPAAPRGPAVPRLRRACGAVARGVGGLVALPFLLLALPPALLCVLLARIAPRADGT